MRPSCQVHCRYTAYPEPVVVGSGVCVRSRSSLPVSELPSRPAILSFVSTVRGGVVKFEMASVAWKAGSGNGQTLKKQTHQNRCQFVPPAAWRAALLPGFFARRPTVLTTTSRSPAQQVSSQAQRRLLGWRSVFWPVVSTAQSPLWRCGPRIGTRMPCNHMNSAQAASFVG